MINPPLQKIGILAVMCIGISALAQAPSSTNAVSSVQQSPAINFQILSQTQVDEPNGSSTTFNFVAPPVFPVAIPVVAPSLTAAYTQWLQARANKTLKFLTLSATVYDHRITDLSCSDGTSTCRVFSDIDFSYFTGMGEFETADTIYDYILFESPATSESLTENSAQPALNQSNQATLGWLSQAEGQLLNLSLAPGSQSSYLVAESSDTSGLLSSLNDMHAFYDANHTQLIAAFEQRLATEAAAEAYAVAHPPGPPPPVVINLWPIKNSRYLTTGTGGNNQ